MNTYYVGSIPISDELYHHGIKGQKWGIRRYQNPDGSLTPAGIARYGTVENFNRAQEEQRRRESREYEYRTQQKQQREQRRFNMSIERGKTLHQNGYSHAKNVLKTAGELALKNIGFGVAFGLAKGSGSKALAATIGAEWVASNVIGVYGSVRKGVDYERARSYTNTYVDNSKKRK